MRPRDQGISVISTFQLLCGLLLYLRIFVDCLDFACQQTSSGFALHAIEERLVGEYLCALSCSVAFDGLKHLHPVSQSMKMRTRRQKLSSTFPKIEKWSLADELEERS